MNTEGEQLSSGLSAFIIIIVFIVGGIIPMLLIGNAIDESDRIQQEYHDKMEQIYNTHKY